MSPWTTLDTMPRPRFDALHRDYDRWNLHVGREIHQKDPNRDTYIRQSWSASASCWRPIIGECKCLVIDLSLSDESHARHDDSSDQDLDEEHRIGGLGIIPKWVMWTWF